MWLSPAAAYAYGTLNAVAATMVAANINFLIAFSELQISLIGEREPLGCSQLAESFLLPSCTKYRRDR
jgi:hypothetical protein